MSIDSNDVVAHACGRCLVVREAHHVPDACFGCGARFDRGAPLALVHVDVEPDGLGIAITPRIAYSGTWSRDAQTTVDARVAAMLAPEHEHAT